MTTERAQAMLLCAGLGTRLRPLTESLPKPLVPVGDRPLLAHLARALLDAGFSRAVVNSHWKSEKILEYSISSPIALQVVHEPRIRGVAGGIAGARALLEAPIVVWNGDVLLESPPPLAAMLERVRASGGACLAVAEAAGAGTLGLGARGCVVRARGRSFGSEERGADYVGLAALGDRALRELPEQGCLIGDYLLPRLAVGEVIETQLIRGGWHDVGSASGYASANRAWLARHANAGAAGYVHPSARVAAGVELRQSVVGAGASVSGRGVVSGCIVWPGAVALAPLSDVAVAPDASLSLVGASWG
jgi:mannose-1-phosphate guanylyltransferase